MNPLRRKIFVYLAYFDDSNTKSKTSHWQVMCAVVVKDTDFHSLELVMGSIAEHLPPDKVSAFAEFKACELYGGYGVFEGIEQPVRFEMIESLLYLLDPSGGLGTDPTTPGKLPIIYGAVNLDQLKREVYASANSTDMAFRICAVGVNDWVISKFVTGPEDDLVIFIADDCDKDIKRTMQESFRSLRKPVKPPDFGASGALFSVHDDMYFGDSKFSIGIQLADLCSYFIACHLNEEQDKEGFYQMIEPYIVFSQCVPETRNAKAIAVQGISELRPDDAGVDKSSSQQDQSQAGRGEVREKEKAEG